MLCCSLMPLPLLAAAALVAPRLADAPPLPKRAATLAGFVPPGWRTLGEARGDLNGDGLADIVAVLGSRREESAPADADLPPRLLLVALAGRGKGGTTAGYRRAALDQRAVFARSDGGAFGDPFADIRVERGTLALEHYGGSRERWGYTDRFRLQNGAWEQIGRTSTSMDAFEPGRTRSRDVNLNTGRVVETKPASGPGGGRPVTRVYHEVFAAPTGRAPQWPPPNAPLGRTVRLTERADVIQNADAWRGPADLAATISAAVHAGALHLRAQVRDDRVAPGDMVRVVDEKGRPVSPARTGTRTFAGGYVWQGRYPLSALGVRPANQQTPAVGYAAASISASVEVWDADGGGSAPTDRGAVKTLSASRGGRTFPARIRLTRAARLPRLGDPAPGAAFYSD